MLRDRAEKDEGDCSSQEGALERKLVWIAIRLP